MSSSNYPKRLIEVDLPIKEISAHARREKSIRHGHISTLHIWWAWRPLAACRAVLCASLWPDPADENCPHEFREHAANSIIVFAEKVHSNKISWIMSERLDTLETNFCWNIKCKQSWSLGWIALCPARFHCWFCQLGCFYDSWISGNVPISYTKCPRSAWRNSWY